MKLLLRNISTKTFAIEIERTNQSPFIIFQGQKDHEDEPIKKAQEFIETNYWKKITVDELAAMFPGHPQRSLGMCIPRTRIDQDIHSERGLQKKLTISAT